MDPSESVTAAVEPDPGNAPVRKGPRSIRESVANKLVEMAPQVEDRLVNQLVETELVKRTELLGKGFKEYNDLDKMMKRLGPDDVKYNEDGSVATRLFSKAKLDEKNKLAEKITKFEKAIEAALVDNKFDQLQNLCNDGNSKGEATS